MKDAAKKVIVVSIVVVMLTAVAPMQAALLWYLPFDTDMNEAINGEAPTEVFAHPSGPQAAPMIAAGLGVGGGGALDMRPSASSMGGVGGWVRYGSPESALQSPMQLAMNDLKSFTFMGWFNTMDDSVYPGNNARMIVRGLANNFTTYFAGGNGRMGQAVNSSFALTPYGTDAWAIANEWVFFATVFDGDAGEVRFYIGGEDMDAVTLVQTIATTQTKLNTATGPIAIGNNGYEEGSAVRVFDGLLDELRLFGSTDDAGGALSVEEITYWKNTVPEPATLALLGLGFAGVIGRKSRRIY